jgi:RNA polymerase sigma factor (sigma-70 family)
MTTELTQAQEKTLIEGCLKGDNEAWGTFISAYKKLVYSRINKICKSNNSYKEDIFQEVFLKIIKNDFKSLRRFGYRIKLSTWVAIITRNVAISYMRKHGKVIEETVSIASEIKEGISVEDCLPDDKKSPREEYDEKAVGVTVKKARESLSPEERQIIDLFFDNQIKIEYIAKAMGISVGAVNMRKKRALEKIKAALKKSVTLQ